MSHPIQIRFSITVIVRACWIGMQNAVYKKEKSNEQEIVEVIQKRTFQTTAVRKREKRRAGDQTGM
jgi:hypothetical protein